MDVLEPEEPNESRETHQVCRLCSNFRLPPKPDSSVKKCINPDCDQKYFNITPNEMISYYLIFLRATLSERKEDQKYRTLLGKKFSSRYYRETSYRVAWEFFIEEVVNNRDIMDIACLGVYYSRGIGVKKSSFMADLFFALSEKYRSLCLDDIDLCPVCTVNPDNGEGSLMCEVCTKMVCGFCQKRLPTKKCPSCNSDWNGTLVEKMEKLRKAIRTRRGRNIENAKVFLGWAVLKCPSEPNHQAYMLASEAIANHCDKGYLLLATLYLTGKGCVKNVPTAIRILETGVLKGRPECMLELAKIHNTGEGTKKNKHKAMDFYKLAALNGSCTALNHLHRLKCE